jgi:hypothetical protein
MSVCSVLLLVRQHMYLYLQRSGRAACHLWANLLAEGVTRCAATLHDAQHGTNAGRVCVCVCVCSERCTVTWPVVWCVAHRAGCAMHKLPLTPRWTGLLGALEQGLQDTIHQCGHCGHLAVVRGRESDA